MKSKEPKLEWTDERIALLKRMWKEKKSAADIAKALGKNVTRNAVIGKAHRMGLSVGSTAAKKPEMKPEAKTTKKPTAAQPKPKPTPSPKPVAAPKSAPISKKAIVVPIKSAKEIKSVKKESPALVNTSPVTVKKSQEAQKPTVQKPLPIALVKVEKVPPPPPLPFGGVALIDLTERMCKWPIGDPKEAEFSFCGRPIRPATPYCPEHAAQAYQASGRKNIPIVPIANEDKEEEEDVVVEEEAEIETVV